MFEKFTEKAINLITESQNLAREMSNIYVQPEHLLLAIINQAKGIPLKLFRMYGVTFDIVKNEVDTKLRFEKASKEMQNIPFSEEFKNILKQTLDLANKSGNQYVLFEHLFIAVITDNSTYSPRILEKLNFDIKNAVDILSKIVQKKIKKMSHPEIDDSKDSEISKLNLETLFEDEMASNIFNLAMNKLSESRYEILGTEQIFSAILEMHNSDITNILDKNGLNLNNFEQHLANETSRQAEYDEKKVVFTPSAFKAMEQASQIAKELGSPLIKPEHIILGILESKKGVAYNILKKMNINSEDLTQEILKPIEKQMPQALTILRLAKQEARRLGRSVVGSEMILLGIISEGTGIGFTVLNNLGITLKDVRQEIEKLIGYGNEYYDKEVVFTKRAKKILEVAWEKSKKYNRPRIVSEHLLYAITTEPSALAMKALEQLGVDAVEIRQGILSKIEH